MHFGFIEGSEFLGKRGLQDQIELKNLLMASRQQQQHQNRHQQQKLRPYDELWGMG